MAGLAEQMVGPAQDPSMAQQMGGAVPTIEEIVALLMQGIPPEKIVEMGVPPELLMEAIALLEQQMAAQQSVPPEAQGGLAAQQVGV